MHAALQQIVEGDHLVQTVAIADVARELLDQERIALRLLHDALGVLYGVLCLAEVSERECIGIGAFECAHGNIPHVDLSTGGLLLQQARPVAPRGVAGEVRQAAVRNALFSLPSLR